jgi:hypothetical protein
MMQKPSRLRRKLEALRDRSPAGMVVRHDRDILRIERALVEHRARAKANSVRLWREISILDERLALLERRLGFLEARRRRMGLPLEDGHRP